MVDSIDKQSIYFSKNAGLTCVYAFFFVTLQREYDNAEKCKK